MEATGSNETAALVMSDWPVQKECVLVCQNIFFNQTQGQIWCNIDYSYGHERDLLKIK